LAAVADIDCRHAQTTLADVGGAAHDGHAVILAAPPEGVVQKATWSKGALLR